MSIGRDQHAILQVLSEYRFKFNDALEKDEQSKMLPGLTWQQVATTTGFSKNKLDLITATMFVNKEIATNNFHGENLHYITAPDGLAALSSKKYIRESRKNVKEDNWVLIEIGKYFIGAIVGAIITLIVKGCQ